MSRHLSFLTAALVGFAPPLVAQTRDFSTVDSLVGTAVKQIPLDGCAVRIDEQGRNVYRRFFGNASATSTVITGSTSKWFTTAVFLTLVDDNKVALDDKVSKYVPYFTGEKAAITIRQLLTHTSGLPDTHASLNMFWLTLEQCTQLIALDPLIHAPGKKFSYGQTAYQVVGHLAEKVSGKSWRTLVKERMTGPLGMTRTDYDGFGNVSNPLLSFAMRTTPDDFANFLEMIRGGGKFATKQILSPASIHEMVTNQIKGIPIRSHPYPDKRGYGLGVFLDRVDEQGRALQISHQGLLGFSPWIDFERGVAATFSVQILLDRVTTLVDRLQNHVCMIVPAPGAHPYGTTSPACSGPQLIGIDRTAMANTSGVTILGRGAPPLSPGLIVLGLLPSPGLDFFGAKVYVSPVPLPLFLYLVSDQNGDSRLPVPLRGIAPNTRFYSQWEWLNPPQCLGKGRVSASHGIEVVVQ